MPRRSPSALEMAGQLFQHMVEEADAGRNARCTGAVDVDGHGDRGFVGLARNAAGALGLLVGHQVLPNVTEPLHIRRWGKYPEVLP
jgi:hypothetical protein